MTRRFIEIKKFGGVDVKPRNTLKNNPSSAAISISKRHFNPNRVGKKIVYLRESTRGSNKHEYCYSVTKKRKPTIVEVNYNGKIVEHKFEYESKRCTF